MKKKLFVCLLLCLVLLSSFSCLALADSRAHVGDSAGLLSADEYTELENMCAAVSDKYGCGVYIITVSDFRPFGNSVESAAEAIFKGTGMGVGDSGNGVMLLLSMEERDYDLLAHGSIGNAAFTDYGKDLLADSFLSYFRQDDWFGGFKAYISSCEYFLQCASEGQPIDVPAEKPLTFAQKLPVIVLIPCVIAGIVCLICKAGMKTARRKTGAAEYITPNSFYLRVRDDIFKYRTQSVERIQRSENRPSGGGGTTVNAGGFSHKSGKF